MKPKIVVVEDDEHSRYLTSFILQKSGYEVISACTGQEGVEAVRREQPQLVILDIQLPGINGYEVIQILRTMPEARDIPIVVVTSYAMPGDREQILSTGCQGYLEKPINPDTFIREIEEYMMSTPRPGWQLIEDTP